MQAKISKELKDLERKLDKQRKEKVEQIIKEKLDQKKLDYDIITLILEIFDKSKFRWHKEHFDIFDSKSNSFRGKELPSNNRECVMLGLRLGTIRSKINYNLRDRQIKEEERQSIDDLVWDFVWYQWKEARMLYDYSTNGKK
ncbi:hypothetical protein NZNM25_12710 [Nitrosopumilus zosterae]|uniref:Uncharacterized protein n=2 Tax=Nitrosopumilus TaxID=338191 RepID=A0A2S2KS20_9ARCH|nr:hypothetical protein [Nitrosopumilus zosterae]BDQ30905.1 hypothetical protein NZOSNM25_001013 [Nitrosopumilus zosterae]GBH34480.1 hypothetical protein NZNM25_12710 [Nitrosopumilus zosterae]